MRLCLNDSGLPRKLSDVQKEDLQKIYNIGFRVIGLTADPTATEDDIKRVKDLLGEVGLVPATCSTGYSPFSPDPKQSKEWTKHFIEGIKVASKIGVQSVRMAGGSMNPENRWMHHPENHTQKALDLYIDHTNKLKAVAEDYRVMLVPETTNFTILDTVQRMKEYVDRVNSPYVKVIFDVVNKLSAYTVYQNARFVRCAIATLGDRIGVLHVKDVMVQDKDLVSHIDEAPMGDGILDHAAVIKASNQLEPWKTFSLEHFNYPNMERYDMWVKAYKHIMKVSNEIGHEWTNPGCTREKWEQCHCK